MAVNNETVDVSIEALRDLCLRIVAKTGMPPDEAGIFVETLIEADRRGVHSHGVVSLTRYVRLLLDGTMKPAVQWTVVRDKGPTAVWDGERSNGQMLGHKAMKEAIQKAKEFGIGMVCVRNANHFGAAAYYAQLAESEGMIGISMSTAAPTMAPWGGADKLTGNNPLAVAVPAKAHAPLVLDMAQSVVAVGKIDNLKRQKKAELPAGWALDSDGVPTDKMEKVFTAAPFGAYKGSGLALIIEVISGLMFGGATAPESADAKRGTSMCMCAIDIEAFSGRESFLGVIDDRIDELKSSRLAAGSEAIYMPGEIEHNKHEAATKNVTLIREIVAELNDLAEETGVDGKI